MQLKKLKCAGSTQDEARLGKIKEIIQLMRAWQGCIGIVKLLARGKTSWPSSAHSEFAIATSPANEPTEAIIRTYYDARCYTYVYEQCIVAKRNCNNYLRANHSK